MAATSWSFTPRFTTATSVVEMSAASSAASASRRTRASRAPRSASSASSSRLSNCKYTSSPGLYAASRATNAGSCAIRTPLVLIITCRIGRALTASRIAKNSGWIVGSPPDSCTRSGSPSLATSASSMRSTVATGRWLPCTSAASAKQTGQARLHAALISTIARQLCCSWSGQSPQSNGQPASVRVCAVSGRSPGLSHSAWDRQ